MKKFLLPKGSIINVEIVALVTLRTGAVLPAEQTRFCCRETGRKTMGQIGYRRVISRQLINPPEFKLKKSDLSESDVKAAVHKLLSVAVVEVLMLQSLRKASNLRWRDLRGIGIL